MLVSRSLSTKPSWMVHWAPPGAAGYGGFGSPQSAGSMVSSRGSTRRAVSMVRCLEAADGQVQDVIQRGEQHLQLFPGAVREPELLVVELLGGLLDVHGMSPIRSKSPMAWSKRETVRISCMDSPCWEISTR